MTKLSENTYIVGRIVATKLTSEQAVAAVQTYCLNVV